MPEFFVHEDILLLSRPSIKPQDYRYNGYLIPSENYGLQVRWHGLRV